MKTVAVQQNDVLVQWLLRKQAAASTDAELALVSQYTVVILENFSIVCNLHIIKKKLVKSWQYTN